MNIRKILRQSHLYAGLEDDIARIHVWLLKLKAHYVIHRYLRDNSIRKLQIGAGPTKSDEWLTTDIVTKLRRKTIYLDATTPYPLPDAAIDYIFSEHMIEHIPYLAGQKMLHECRRVLKPGGKIRLATPDLARMLALMYAEPDTISHQYIQWSSSEFLPLGTPHTAIHVLNNQFRNYGHQFLYDEACLSDALAKAGFVDIRRVEMGQSSDVNLRGADKHGINAGNEAMIAFESLVMEAVKA
jgi:predicted SAM-dependent methyltransferase